MASSSTTPDLGVPTPSSDTNPTVVRRIISIDPPPGSENLDLLGYVALPAIGASANIIKFTIPSGRNGVIKKVACNFVGGGWVEGSGAVTWSIQADGAPPPGSTNYDTILDSLGSPVNPVELCVGFRVFENQVLTLVITNVSVVVAGQLAGARLVGYLYPVDLEDDDVWL